VEVAVMSVKFKARLPREVPASAVVYELRPVSVTPASLKTTAKSLGLAGSAGASSSRPTGWRTARDAT
jgi:hypothetical protein